jgi:bifunctional lysine-specific demethylase and histidyl-hydroxylase NO66
MTVGPTALARCVGDVETFARTSWGREAVVRRGAGPYVDLLDVDVVERLLMAPARRPMFRMVRDGSPLPVADYTSSRRLGGVTVADVADVSRVMRLLADGATVVLQSLQHWCPPIARFCSDMQSETSHVVQANSYLSPAGSNGLARHHDTHEVIVLQVEGSKAWSVDALGDLTLEPGDMLYIPAGTSHEAAAQSGFSLHLTIGILATTYRSVLRRALDAVDDAELDRPLPLGFARADHQGGREATERSIAVAVGEFTSGVRPSVLFDAEIRRSIRSRHPLPSGHLRSLMEAPGIVDDVWIRAHPQLEVTASHGRLTLRAAGRQLSVPGAIGEAATAVATGEPIAVNRLPGLDGASQAVFARRLIRESIAFVVDPVA